MMRKMMVTLGLAVACGLAVGCGGSSGTGGAKPSGDKSAADKLKDGAKDVADKGKDAAKDVADKGKELLTKGRDELLKGLGIGDMKVFEDKIKALTGDAQKDAQGKYDAVKNMIAEMMKGDKLDGWKEKLEPLVAALKKACGL